MSSTSPISTLSPILKLPDEILVSILSHDRNRDLSLVCRAFARCNQTVLGQFLNQFKTNPDFQKLSKWPYEPLCKWKIHCLKKEEMFELSRNLRSLYERVWHPESKLIQEFAPPPIKPVSSIASFTEGELLQDCADVQYKIYKGYVCNYILIWNHLVTKYPALPSNLGSSSEILEFLDSNPTIVDQIVEIDLSNQKALTVLPCEFLRRFKNLKKIKVAGNHIGWVALLNSDARVRNRWDLDLRQNHIHKLPPKFSNLESWGLQIGKNPIAFSEIPGIFNKMFCGFDVSKPTKKDLVLFIFYKCLIIPFFLLMFILSPFALIIVVYEKLKKRFHF